MSEEYSIRRITEGRQQICERMLCSLPRWFGIESAIQDYIRDIAELETFAAFTSRAECIGFLALQFHNENNAEIHVMGVLPHFHGKGIGTLLVSEAGHFAFETGRRFLTVKTLSPGRTSEEYDRTRKFYLSKGFIALEEFKSLWGESNPCLQMIKVL